MQHSFPLLVLLLLCISLLSPSTALCPHHIMEERANSYLAAQVNHDWSTFFPYLSDDATLYTNVLSTPTASGKPATMAALSSIGYLFQSILAVVEGPTNYFRPNSLVASFVKTQTSLVVNVPHNLSFMHIIDFNDACQITAIREGPSGFSVGRAYAKISGQSPETMPISLRL